MTKLPKFLTLGLLLALPAWSQGANPARHNSQAITPLQGTGATDNVVWAPAANALYTFGRAGTAVLGNFLYCIGSENMDSSQAFNIMTEQWVPSTKPPWGIDNWPAVATNSAIYLIGGTEILEIGDQVQRFTPTGSGPTGTWAIMAHYPHVAFGVCGVWDGGNYLYAAGGFTIDTHLQEAYRYDIAANQWDQIAPLPEAMGFAGAAFIQGRFHVMGGNYSGQSHYSYNPADNTWSNETPVPTNIFFATSSVSCNDHYIFSVGGGGGYAGWTATNAVQIYNPANGQWAQETPLPDARGCNSAAWIGGGKVISAGGWVAPWTNQAYKGVGFPGGAVPLLHVTLTPISPPIVVPANGGSFNFSAALVDSGPQAQAFAVWTRMKYPNGSWTAPVLGPLNINPPLNVTITRQRTQNIPGTYSPGLYYYAGYVAQSYGSAILDSSYFTFTKSTNADGGPFQFEASCMGELFPNEEAASSQPATFSLRGASPNPFNPTTTISYELQAASQVSLKVYDTVGRLVATLVDDQQEAGTHLVTFEGSHLVSGLYFVQMTAGGRSETQKIMLLK
jgi:hypothetical protein